jgi:hypothetical protein
MHSGTKKARAQSAVVGNAQKVGGKLSHQYIFERRAQHP